MNIWRITPAEPRHIQDIAQNLREADRREVWASHRHSPEEALRTSLELSDLAWTCFVEGKPSFMWGAARRGSILSEVGAPWLLGTDAILKVKTAFLRQSRGYVRAMQARFPMLENYVHAGNALSRRWLKWCGFTFDDGPVLINDETFFRFWREASCAR